MSPYVPPGLHGHETFKSRQLSDTYLIGIRNDCRPTFFLKINSSVLSIASKKEVQLILFGLRTFTFTQLLMISWTEIFYSFQAVIKTNSKRGHILVFFVVESDHAHKGIVTDWGTKLNLHFLQKWYLISMKSQFFP